MPQNRSKGINIKDMENKIIDGKAVSDQIKKEIAAEIANILDSGSGFFPLFIAAVDRGPLLL